MSPHQNLNNNRCMGKKKDFSYASLISQALINSPNNRLTLKEIYNYISTNYPDFTSRKKGWQNSIRHNLSLNKAFFKEPKMKGTPGKGSYWTINHSEAKLLLNKTEQLTNLHSRIRRGYGHTNQSTYKRRSPFLDEIQMADDTRIKQQNFSVFNGHLNDGRLNPFNSSLEAYFGMPNRHDQEEDDPYNQEMPFRSNNMSDYFRFE
ncbi:Transcription factor of the Forkhead/HNF3 family [Pseudoloma neurophilia]|uniref:Transcription factor of the Forkhead/HNF3 family n=1 Tax=Pseudoloma neurophilia TaxID=146866 RepID=A0A0R0M0U1_9MICR|nr:Transcription factor of the Forkhead/HNF3 family [Pseudoloma neurophilia]